MNCHNFPISLQVANKDVKVSDTKWTVPGLQEGKEYEFRVTAENKAGQGPPSAPSKPAKYGEYRSNTVKPKSFRGNALLRIKWKFKLQHEATAVLSYHLMPNEAISRFEKKKEHSRFKWIFEFTVSDL